jgi:hypothetical protein
MNTKIRYKIILNAVFLMISVLFSGCNLFETDKIYCQLTSDELSHLYFDRDTLILDGNPINYIDTIAFLYNSNDTMRMVVNTYIYSPIFPYDPSHPSVFGSSTFYFEEQTGFKHARVKVKQDFGDKNALITIDFPMLIGGCSDILLNQPLDTANVLGKEYQNVYKITFPDNSFSKLKYIYFAKKFGFIKIETADRKKLERVDL